MQMFTPSRASRRSARRSNCDDALSKPVVGSSKINREGSITISSPTFTRFLWPPEIPRFSTVPTSESLTACSPKDSITLSITKTLSGFAKSADSLQCYVIHQNNSQNEAYRTQGINHKDNKLCSRYMVKIAKIFLIYWFSMCQK